MIIEIEENDLVCLISMANRMEALEWDGVDNWSGYGDSFKKYKADWAESLGIDKTSAEDMTFEELARIEVKQTYGKNN